MSVGHSHRLARGAPRRRTKPRHKRAPGRKIRTGGIVTIRSKTCRRTRKAQKRQRWRSLQALTEPSYVWPPKQKRVPTNTTSRRKRFLRKFKPHANKINELISKSRKRLTFSEPKQQHGKTFPTKCTLTHETEPHKRSEVQRGDFRPKSRRVKTKGKKSNSMETKTDRGESSAGSNSPALPVLPPERTPLAQKPVSEEARKRKRRMERHHKETVKVCQLNIRTFAEKHILRNSEILAELRSQGCKIIGFQEMKRQHRGGYHDSSSGYHVFFSKDVGFAIDEKLSGESGCTPVYHDPTDRLASIRFRIRGGQCLHVFSGHAPTETASKEAKDTFWLKLLQQLQHIPATDRILVLIDANARTGQRDDDNLNGILGTAGRDELNDNGTRLIELAGEVQLAILNTFFHKPRSKDFTYRSPRGQKMRLDYILVRQRERKEIKDVYNHTEIIDKQKGWTDHAAVMVRIKLKVRPHHHRKKAANGKKVRLDLDTLLENEDMKRAFEEKFRQHLPQDPEANQLSNNDRANTLSKALFDSAFLLLGKAKPQTKREGWIHRKETQEELLAWKIVKDEAWRKFKASGSDEARRNYRRAKRQHKKRCTYLFQRDLEQRCDELHAMWKKGQVKAMYSQLKNNKIEKSICNNTIQFIRDESGTLLTKEEDIVDRWRRHFESLLNHAEMKSMPQALQQMTCSPVCKHLAKTPSLEETMTAVSMMKHGKSTGEDGVPVELLSSSEYSVKHLHQLIVSVWESEEVPNIWRNATISILHKKGDKTLCGNYRGLSLISHVAKVFLKVLVTRLSAYIERENLLPEEQCGFRPRRSTLDMIYVAKLLQEHARAKNTELYFCFVDLTKAYDMVNRGILWKILEKVGVPRKMISIIRGFHENMQARVLVHGQLSNVIEVTGGLRQGCPLAPVLFNIYFAAVLNATSLEIHENPSIAPNLASLKPKKVIGAIPQRLKQLGESGKFEEQTAWQVLFADDTGLVATSAEALSSMMACLVRTCADFGLHVSEKKTEAMVSRVSKLSPRVELNITGGEQSYRQTNSFVYLGSKVSELSDISIELKRRVQIAFMKMKRFGKQLFDNQAMWLKYKVVMFKQEVLEALLYGCSTWTMKLSDYDYMEGIHRKLLCRICRIWKSKTDPLRKRPVSYREVLRITKCETLGTLIRRRRLTYAGHLVRMKDGRLPKLLLLSELAGGRGRRGAKKTWRTCLADDLKTFNIPLTKWISLASSETTWAQVIENGARSAMYKWIKAEDSKAQLRADKRRNTS